jgi:hypothetical protein
MSKGPLPAVQTRSMFEARLSRFHARGHVPVCTRTWHVGGPLVCARVRLAVCLCVRCCCPGMPPGQYTRDPRRPVESPEPGGQGGGECGRDKKEIPGVAKSKKNLRAHILTPPQQVVLGYHHCWWVSRGSNTGPLDLQSNALPTELFTL